MKLRPVDDQDVFRLYRWAIDSETQRFRAASRREIDLDEHVRWFIERMGHPHWWIAEVPTSSSTRKPVGVCRFDMDARGKAWIAIVCDPLERGKGYGTKLIASATAAYLAEAEQECVYALIHRLNTPSVRAFEKAGYVKERQDGVWLVFRKD